MPDGAIFITDAGYLRRIYNGEVSTINFEAEGIGSIRARIVRAYEDDLWILTRPWIAETAEGDRLFQGIIRYTNGRMDGFFVTDTSSISDIAVANGRIYFIERPIGVMLTYLRAIDISNGVEVHTLAELPEGVISLAVGNGRIYLADYLRGVLMYFDYNEAGTVAYLAGVAEYKAFIDTAVASIVNDGIAHTEGVEPLFFQPSRLRYHDGVLYVWDFNVLRRITLVEGIAQETITLAGVASPDFLHEINGAVQQGENVIFPNSQLMDFTFIDDGILLTDPKRGVIWRFQ
jgi:hypothetical protein